MTASSNQPPLMQRLYNRIWLLAAVSTVFFYVVYLVWALVDIAAVPGG